jgi:hypothetical protein
MSNGQSNIRRSTNLDLSFNKSAIRIETEIKQMLARKNRIEVVLLKRLLDSLSTNRCSFLVIILFEKRCNVIRACRGNTMNIYHSPTSMKMVSPRMSRTMNIVDCKTLFWSWSKVWKDFFKGFISVAHIDLYYSPAILRRQLI